MGWVTCARCSEKFALTPETEDTLRRSGGTFNCPWGHPQHFPLGKSEADKLKDQLEAERRQRQRAEQNAAYEASRAVTAERRASAYKGQATRIRKRAKAGTCPCCKRTFSELANHMARQHPDFSVEPEEPADART